VAAQITLQAILALAQLTKDLQGEQVVVVVVAILSEAAAAAVLLKLVIQTKLPQVATELVPQ